MKSDLCQCRPREGSFGKCRSCRQLIRKDALKSEFCQCRRSRKDFRGKCRDCRRMVDKYEVTREICRDDSDIGHQNEYQFAQDSSYSQNDKQSDIFQDSTAALAPQSQLTQNGLTQKQSLLQTLYVGIWREDYRLQPLSVGFAIDSGAHANFISVGRVNELGYVLESLPQYRGLPVRTACGGNVWPVAHITLKWHVLQKSSVDYEDDFLVINGDKYGGVFGIKTIEGRGIYNKGIDFNTLAMSPVDQTEMYSIQSNSAQLIAQQQTLEGREMRDRLLTEAQRSVPTTRDEQIGAEWSGWKSE